MGVWKYDTFYTRNALIWGRRRRSLASKGSLLRQIQQWFLKIITPLDPRNSKNSKRTMFLVSELCFLCSKACVLYFLVKNIIWTVANGTYYIICPICCNHCIPCWMCFKVIYSFLMKMCCMLDLCTIFTEQAHFIFFPKIIRYSKG